MTDERLAINGGEKAVKGLSPAPPKIARDELLELLDLWEFSPEGRKRLREIIESEAELGGPHLFRYYGPEPSRVAAVEQLMAEQVGVKHCLAVNSGTSALITAFRALGIGAGDEVIVPAYTFFATAATVAAANAVPVIVEVDDSLTMDPAAAEAAITPRTKAIAAVHMRGAPAQLDALGDLAKRKGVHLVEDVAQAIGGSFGGKPLGSIGTMGCFSLNFTKAVASGEGGFVTTNNEWLYTRAQSWHDMAACWRPNRFARERKPGELFCGENYRMTEMEGAVALVQLRKMPDIISAKRRVKNLIKKGIETRPGLAFRRLTDPEGDSAMWLVLYLPDADTTRKAGEALKAEGVPAGGLYDSSVRDWHVYSYWDQILEKKAVAPDGLPWSAIPEDEQPAYSRDMCPRTLDLLARSIHIDIFGHYSDADCTAIANGINKVMRAYLK